MPTPRTAADAPRVIGLHSTASQTVRGDGVLAWPLELDHLELDTQRTWLSKLSNQPAQGVR